MNRKAALPVSLWGIFFIGVILRTMFLGSDSYWFDEANSIGFTQWPMKLFFRHYYIQRPLYFLILRIWVDVFGNHEVVARWLSVVLGSVSILALYQLAAAIFNKSTAIFSSLILALSFFHILFSRTLMNYTLFCLLSIMCSYYFMKLIKFRQKQDFVFLCLFSLVNILTHPFALFMVLIQNIVIIAWHRNLWNRYWIITQVCILIGAIFILWTLFAYPSFEQTYQKIIHQVDCCDRKPAQASFLLSLLAKVYEAFTFGGRKMGHSGHGFPVLGWTLPWGYFLLVVYSVLLAIGLKHAWKCTQGGSELKKGMDPILPLPENMLKKIFIFYSSLMIFVPIIAVTMIQPWIQCSFYEKYFLFSYPLFIILVSVGFDEGIRANWLKRVTVLTVSICAIIYSVNLAIPARMETWRDIAALVKKNIKEQDSLVLIPFGQITPFWFYFDKSNKSALMDKTMNGIYQDGGWSTQFEWNAHLVLGNRFRQIDAFLQEQPFRKLASKKKDIWLVMSPYWERNDAAEEKVYRSIKEAYKRVFYKYFSFNGVSVEKWERIS